MAVAERRRVHGTREQAHGNIGGHGRRRGGGGGQGGRGADEEGERVVVGREGELAEGRKGEAGAWPAGEGAEEAVVGE